MEFEYRYHGSTAVDSSARSTNMSFSPDTRREPTYFVGELGKALEFREAISALHDVVVSDLRWKPKDRTQYKEWLAQQEQINWQQVERFKPYGGIRIEDNVAATTGEPENLTRPAFAPAN